jgi:ubiquinone/menaquinone biosynthesis C-methylase UbiE
MQIAARLPSLPSLPVLRARFHAWWEGYDLPATKPAAAEEEEARTEARPAAKPPARPEAKQSREIWPRERIDLAQILWGKEFVSPLGAAPMTELIAPLALAAGMNVLHLGCGLGGFTRAMAQAFGVTATGMDESVALAKAGMELSTRAKLGKAAPVGAADLKTVEFKPAFFERAVIEHILHMLDDKEAALKRIAHALKPDAQVLILDYVFQGKTTGPAIAAWAKVDPAPVQPWNLDAARKTLAKLHIDARAVEDQTDRTRALIVAGLDAFLKGAASQAVNRKLTAALKGEIDLWAARKAALDAGEIKVFAIHGVKVGEAG